MSATFQQPVLLLAFLSSSHRDKRPIQLAGIQKSLQRLFTKPQASSFYSPLVVKGNPGENAENSWFTPQSREQITVLHLAGNHADPSFDASPEANHSAWLKRADSLPHLKAVILDHGASNSLVKSWLAKDIPAVIVLPHQRDSSGESAISDFHRFLAEGESILEAAYQTAFKNEGFGVHPVGYNLEMDDFTTRQGSLAGSGLADSGLYYLPDHRHHIETKPMEKKRLSLPKNENPSSLLRYVAPRVLAGLLGFGWGVGLIALYHYLQDPEAFQQFIAMIAN